MNPAVSLSMLLRRNLGLLRFGVYIIAQCLGSFLAAALVFLAYYDNINKYDGGSRQTIGPQATAGIFTTFRSANISNGSALLDQVVGTSLLVGLVLAITDKQNEDMEHGFKAIMLGNAILAIGLSFGMNAGYPINPARDLMPRIFTAIAGWGSEVFTVYDYYFWVPIVGPFIGAVAAVVVYDLFMSLHLNEDDF
jgi:MIP family channel proteins